MTSLITTVIAKVSQGGSWLLASTIDRLHVSLCHQPAAVREVYRYAPYATMTQSKITAAFAPPALTISGFPSRYFGDVNVSLHPAGHVLGSAQVRIEAGGDVWVVSGDYKLAPDPTCAPFEPVRCRTFITESTFGLPIYRWDEPASIAAAIRAWWRENQLAGRASVLLVYALGKAQRVLASLADDLPGPLWCHGAVARVNDAYAAAGVALPPVRRVGEAPAGTAIAPARDSFIWIFRCARYCVSSKMSAML